MSGRSASSSPARSDSRRRARRFWWMLLWVSAAIWLFVFGGLMRGWWDFWPVIIASVICLIGAGWSNHRLVSMERARMRGRCWRCGYDLRGSGDATRCAECGELQS